jgi:flavin reductase (DIM6/NTAB) family NADH-FMN oxidoreductase RutF
LGEKKSWAAGFKFVHALYVWSQAVSLQNQSRNRGAGVLKRQIIDSRDYRDAMARYAGHVQIATTAHEGVRRGVTVTAACSVSDNPGTLLVCLNHSNPHNEIFAESGVFALNSLMSGHEDLGDGILGPRGSERRRAVRAGAVGYDHHRGADACGRGCGV